MDAMIARSLCNRKVSAPEVITDMTYPARPPLSGIRLPGGCLPLSDPFAPFEGAVSTTLNQTAERLFGFPF